MEEYIEMNVVREDVEKLVERELEEATEKFGLITAIMRNML